MKDVPIPEEIFNEFQPFIQHSEDLANLFDNYPFRYTYGQVKKVMPSQIKGQNCLDKYFLKVNKNDINNSKVEMGKKNANNNITTAVHRISETDSEPEMSTNSNTNTLEALIQKNHNTDDDDDDLFRREELDCERTPSKPIIAAMNALGKLKRNITEANIDDNSSRDSTTLVIDEEQLESEKEQPQQPEEILQNKINIKKSTIVNDINSPRNSKDGVKPSCENTENESLTFSQFFNTKKVASTPIETMKSVKRKKSACGESSPESATMKRNKDKDVDSGNEPGFLSACDYVDNLVEVKTFKDVDCPLFIEDLDSNDEIYVVQCPNDMNFESLVKKQINLNGESTLQLHVSGEKRHYDCFSQKDSMGRDVNMVIPSRKDDALKFGVYQLKGSIVISETMEDQELISSEQDETIKSPKDDLKDELKEIISPEKRKKHKKKNEIASEKNTTEKEKNSNEDATSDNHENNSSGTIKKKKKKKEIVQEISHIKEETGSRIESDKPSKKRKRETDQERNLYIEDNQISSEEKSSKKKKHEEKTDPTEIEQVGEEVTLRKKKKKKHKTEMENIKLEMEDLATEDVSVPEEKDAEFLPNIKKKKKKKDKGHDIEIESNGNFIVPEQEQPIKKKKKKKHRDEEEEQVGEEMLAVTVVNEDVKVKKKQKSKVKEEENETIGDTATTKETRTSMLSSFVDLPATDLPPLKKKKKKKKKKEREKSID